MILVRCDACGEEGASAERKGWAHVSHNAIHGAGVHREVVAENLDLCPACATRLREYLRS